MRAWRVTFREARKVGAIGVFEQSIRVAVQCDDNATKEQIEDAARLEAYAQGCEHVHGPSRAERI